MKKIFGLVLASLMIATAGNALTADFELKMQIIWQKFSRQQKRLT